MRNALPSILKQLVLGALASASAPADVEAGPVVVQCNILCEGRRPSSLFEPAGQASSVADMLAHSAYLEAASVTAFLDLARELEAHHAPKAFVARAQRAAADEVRHAHAVGALATDRGATVPRVQLGEREGRSLLTLAMENAREGCVRETWGAACVMAESARASDADVRRVMSSVAVDELRHAELAWDVADWLASRLTVDERTLVAMERGRAIDELAAQLEQEIPSAWQQELGLPSRGQAREMIAKMREEVWDVAA